MAEAPQLADQPGDVAAIVALVLESLPAAEWSRLKVKHPTDDDGVWFFWLPGRPGEVQMDWTSTSGLCPFIVETDKCNDRYTGATPEDVAQKIVEWLTLPGGR